LIQSNQIDTEDGLKKQHLDGFGFGWLDKKNKWQHYKKSFVYTEDPHLEKNLDKMSHSSFIVGHIRNKTIGDRSIENTHPFIYKNQLFCHNGVVRDFLIHKEKIMEKIDKKYRSCIKGETDSEHLFYLLLTCIDSIQQREPTRLIDGFHLFFRILQEMNLCVWANIIFATDKTCIITRYVVQPTDKKPKKKARFLYYHDSEEGMIISTRPILKGSHLIKENSILQISLDES
jgi:predicted glutamine amidotransferase